METFSRLVALKGWEDFSSFSFNKSFEDSLSLVCAFQNILKLHFFGCSTFAFFCFVFKARVSFFGSLFQWKLSSKAFPEDVRKLPWSFRWGAFPSFSCNLRGISRGTFQFLISHDLRWTLLSQHSRDWKWKAEKNVKMLCGINQKKKLDE